MSWLNSSSFGQILFFSVLDVTRVGALYTGGVVGKRKSPTLCDECLLGCFTGEGRVAAGMWSEATCPYSANHFGSDEDDHYYQCAEHRHACLLYTSPSPRDQRGSRMPSSA